MAACKAFVQQCFSRSIAKGGHDGNVLSNLKIISARPGYIKTSLPVEKRHLNNHKVHDTWWSDTIGKVISVPKVLELMANDAELTDTVTSLALSTLGIPEPTGASVNISTEFVRPGGRDGDELIGIGEVVKMGRTLAYTKVTFLDNQNRVVAFGSHTKHMGNNVPKTKFSEDGEEELPLEMQEKAKL